MVTRSPLLLSLLIAVAIGACGKPLTPDVSGTGGTSGMGGTGGTAATSGAAGAPGTGGATGTGGAIGTGGTTGTGGAIGTGGGCAMSDPPSTTEIASFASDGGVNPIFGVFTYGSPLSPEYTIAGGVVNVLDTVAVGATSQYQGFGIYFNGNEIGTDCVDASSYTGISFSLSGSLMGEGCAMQFSINDSEHDQSIPGVVDPKAGGPAGSYAPQILIAGADLTSTATTFRVPFAGTGAPVGGSPATPVDPTKLVGVQWQMSTPIASDGGATECVWNVDISNVRFY